MNHKLLQSFSIALASVVLAGMWSCANETPPSSHASPPAKVANGVKEADLATVTLSPEAEQRLGVKTARVEKRRLPHTMRLGGEIIALPGRQAFVTAPVAGIVLAPEGSWPQSGVRVRKGQALLRLLPLPAERDLLGTPEEVALKKIQFEVAQARAKRAAQLLADNAGSEKAHEEAISALASAEAAFKAAAARLRLAQNLVPDSAALALSTMTLASPFDGVIRQINVAPQQTVATGAELFEVASQHPVWVRVPIYVGDLSTLDPQQPAQVEGLDHASGSASRAARAVQGPPLGETNAASADLFFELSNADSRFRLGEKVRVTLTQRRDTESLLVPFSAILYDIHGGTWVYARTAPQVYARQRVELHHVADSLAVLTRGPAPEVEVVSVGAAEIFGTEFGGGK